MTESAIQKMDEKYCFIGFSIGDVIAQLSKYTVLANGTALALILGALHTTPVDKQDIPQASASLWLFFFGLFFAMAAIYSMGGVDLALKEIAFLRAKNELKTEIEANLDEALLLRERTQELEKAKKNSLQFDAVSEKKRAQKQLDKAEEILSLVNDLSSNKTLSQLQKAKDNYSRLGGGCLGISLICCALGLIHVIIFTCPSPPFATLIAIFTLK